MKRQRFLAVAFLALSPMARGAVIVGPIVNPANGHSYYVTSKANWIDAEAEAVSLAGHLVTVDNVAENTWLVNNVLVDFTASGKPNLSKLPLWIGFHDPVQNDGTGAAHAANFVWSSGAPNNYTDWGAGEPNNGGGQGQGEYYAAIGWLHSSPNFNFPADIWNDTYLTGTPGPETTPVVPNQGLYYGIAEVVPEPGVIGLIAIGAVTRLRRRRK